MGAQASARRQEQVLSVYDKLLESMRSGVLICLYTLLSCSLPSSAVVGNGEVEEPDDEFRSIAELLRPDAQFEATAQGAGDFERFDVLSVRKQVVSGTNWFMKVQVSDKDCAHLRLWKPKEKEPQVHSLKLDPGCGLDLSFFFRRMTPKPKQEL